MRKFLVVLLVGIMVGTLGAHYGGALFSDVATSKGNELSTGDFDVRISRDGSRFYDEVKLFEFGNLKPGDEEEVTFHVKNAGDVPFSSLKLAFEVEDFEEDYSDLEASVDGTADVGELSGKVVVNALKVVKEGQVFEVDGVNGKTLKELNGTWIDLPGLPLGPGERMEIKALLRLVDSAGNECLTDRMEVTLRVYASQ